VAAWKVRQEIECDGEWIRDELYRRNGFAVPSDAVRARQRRRLP